MKQFYAFVKKEFMHILRDPRTVLLLLLMPVIQIVLFGFALTNEVKNVKVAVISTNKDYSTERLIQRIDASSTFIVSYYPLNIEEAQKLLKTNKVKVILIFSSNFSSELFHSGSSSLQIITDASDPNLATSASFYMTNIINSYVEEINKKKGIDTTLLINVESVMLHNPQLKSSYNFVPGVMGLILMLICAMMTSISIVREKESGTMEVLLVSPLKPFGVILAKTVPYFVLSAVNLITILLLSIFLLDVPVTGSLFWLIIFSLVFIFISLSLGMMISTLVSTQVAAMLISGMAFMMPVMLLSGMVFPIENMPKFLQIITNIIPARWFIAGVRKLMIQGVEIQYVFKELSILIGMGAIFIVVTLRNFKYRLD